jgi:hypothetical protein
VPATQRSCNLILPVAILDKELRKTTSFRLQIFELCSLCGARFGIGYFSASAEGLSRGEPSEDLPRRLIEILIKDHHQQRAHKGVIELDAF